MRTVQELLNRIEAQKARDFLGFDNQDLIRRLPFEQAKQYLKEDVTEQTWGLCH